MDVSTVTTLQKTISPIDNALYVERPLAAPEQIDRALDAAARAQREWKTVPLAERASLCLAMVDAFVEKADELGVELARQMGRPIRYAPNEIRRGFDERARYMIAAAERALADVRLEAKQGFTRFIRREPLGVVLTLAPLELPLPHVGELGHPRDHGRQYGAAQALQPDAAVCRALRRGVSSGRAAGRRLPKSFHLRTTTR